MCNKNSKVSYTIHEVHELIESLDT